MPLICKELHRTNMQKIIILKIHSKFPATKITITIVELTCSFYSVHKSTLMTKTEIVDLTKNFVDFNALE